jgi:hypothetical protein
MRWIVAIVEFPCDDASSACYDNRAHTFGSAAAIRVRHARVELHRVTGLEHVFVAIDVTVFDSMSPPRFFLTGKVQRRLFLSFTRLSRAAEFDL